jgi:cytochrome c oxidase assembly protein subunit 11
MNANTRVLTRLVGVVVLMGAGAWAAVPFYNWFCATTGFAGTPRVATVAPDHSLDETVTVRFIGSVEKGMPWKFGPVQKQMTLKIGEQGLAFYEAVNLSDRPIAGTASYNVGPDQAGYFFEKIDCFCFTEQILQPGERVEMPVTFFVDPGIVDDRDAGSIRNITLSYTFFETDLPVDQANLTTQDPKTVN